jgi:LmbE family N-acetylglucosaminyl deacetylase
MNPLGLILLVSPHADDVAYSLGGHLASGKLPAERCQLITVFTRSNFAPYCAVSFRDIEGVSKIRAQEDEDFARRKGLKLCRMSLEEAPLRDGIVNVDDLFVPLGGTVGTEASNMVCHLAELLKPWVLRYDLVYGPLGLGGHVDHLIVHRAMQRCLADVSRLRFYEDVPYAGEISLDEYRRQILARTDGMDHETVAENGWLDEKLASLGGYRSQIADKDLASVREAVRRASGERVWFLRPGWQQ